MDTSPVAPSASSATPSKASATREGELKKVFNEFTAGTFYREMLGALRKSSGKPAYFHGGHAEDVFRAELDRQIADDLAERHGDAFAGPLYDVFAQQMLTMPRS